MIKVEDLVDIEDAVNDPTLKCSHEKWVRICDVLTAVQLSMSSVCGLCIKYDYLANMSEACAKCEYGKCHGHDSDYTRVRVEMTQVLLAATRILSDLDKLVAKEAARKEG